MGVGAQVSLDVSNKVTTSTSSNYFTNENGRPGKPIEEVSETTSVTENDPFSDIKYGLFGDVTIGASRIGPSVGARYIYNFNSPNSQLHFYAIWKF